MKCNIVKFITIAVSLLTMLTGLALAEDADAQMKATITSIEKVVVDLTNPLELLQCREFLRVRKSLSKDGASTIVKLISGGNLSTTQSLIGVHLLSGLDEKSYWDVTEPLLSPKTPKIILKSVLIQPFPYGPGFANAFQNKIYQ